MTAADRAEAEALARDADLGDLDNLRLHGVAIGEQYTLLVRALNLTLRVGELRHGLAGTYTIPTRTVTIAEESLGEDPRFVAAALAHEIKHADDADFVGLGLLSADCLEIEARGFDVQAQIARAFWHDALPARTAFELENVEPILDVDGQDVRGSGAHHPFFLAWGLRLPRGYHPTGPQPSARARPSETGSGVRFALTRTGQAPERNREQGRTRRFRA